MKQTIRKILIAVLGVLCVTSMILAVSCKPAEPTPEDSGSTSVSAISSDSSVTPDESSSTIPDSSSTIPDSSSVPDSSSSVPDSSSVPAGPVIVTFNANGGTLTGAATYEADDDGYIDVVPAPTRAGYVFLGWFTAAEGGEEVDEYGDAFEESITLYAHWAEAVTVTFDPCGGTLTGNATIVIAKGSKIEIAPTVTKEGSDFHGWFTAAEGGEQVDLATYVVNGNVTLYARFGTYSMPMKNLKNAAGEKIGYRIEAEACKFIGTPSQEGASIIEQAEAASGGQSLGFLGRVGNQLVFTFYAETAGKATIAVRMASNAYTFDMSNWSITNDDQTVDSSIIDVTFNGEAATFATTILRGSGTSAFNLYFGMISFGELDVVQGDNALVITGKTANFPNTDCLDIVTGLTLKSCNGDAPSGEEIADEGGEPPAPAAYEKNVSANMIIGGYDGGPAVEKIVFTFEDDIPAAAVATRSLVFRWNSNLGNASTDKLYLCDADGNEVSTSTSKYVAIEYTVVGTQYGIGNNLSPFTYQNMNNWKAMTGFGLTMNNFAVGGTTYTSFAGELSVTKSIPILDKWAELAGTHTKDDQTIGYAAYEPVVPAGEKRPLIVWLHGAGEGGNDPTITLLGNKVVALAEERIQRYFDGAFVLAPQAPTMWMDTIQGGGIQSAYALNSMSKYYDALEDLLRTYVAANDKIDATRVYVGGCSNGGWCTLEVVGRMGDFFAGAYPVCAPYAIGHFTPEMFDNLVSVPMWIIAANNDTTVNNNGDSNTSINVDGIAHSKRLYIDMLEAGHENVHFSLFANVNVGGTNYNGHYSWIWVFRDEVKFVQAQTGTGTDGAFTKNDYNTASTLTVTYGSGDDAVEVGLWQWLGTFANDGRRIPPLDLEEPIIEPGDEILLFLLEAEEADVAGVPKPGWWDYVHPGEEFTVVETDKPNASGEACIGSLNSAGATISFTFEADSAGTARLDLYMSSNANQGRNPTTFSTSIFTATFNGEELEFEPQEVAGGTTYSDVFEAVVLGTVEYQAGENTLVITVVNAGSMGNMDCLKVIGFAAPAEPIDILLEAEEADVAGVPKPGWWDWVHPGEEFTVVETDKPNASGQACIGSLNSAGATITFTFEAETAGTARLDLYMSSNASNGTAPTTFSPSIFTATFNDEELDFEPQEVAGGTTYSDVFEAVSLGTVEYQAGENTLVITVVSASGIGNIDCLRIIGV